MTSTSPLAPSATETGSHVPHMPRRQVLRASLAVAAAGGVVATAGRTSAVGSESLPAWSDPATWGTAGVPRPGSVVVVDFPVRLDRDIDVAGLHVECGGHLVLDPQKSVTIRTTGNVEICGLLEMRPARAEVQHLLRFEGIDERRFAGGGMSVLASDVGLWIHEDGQLDLHGTPRTAWVRAAGALSPGARTIRLAAQPTGWRVGDELTITPTGTPVDKSHAARFDQATITSISGSVVTLSSALRYGHPQVAVGDGHVLTAEVLNLTRNVRIEGTPPATGRTSSSPSSSSPQKVKGVAIRHVGPRQEGRGGVQSLVLGRYGLHLHMSQATGVAPGSEVEGVVIRDAGNHTFVPHLSNGIAFRATASATTPSRTPFWWDGAPDTRTPGSPSHDILYEALRGLPGPQSDPAVPGLHPDRVLGRAGATATKATSSATAWPSASRATPTPPASSGPRADGGHLEVQSATYAHNNANPTASSPGRTTGRKLHVHHPQLHRLPQRRPPGISHGAYEQPLHLPRLDPVREPRRGGGSSRGQSRGDRPALGKPVDQLRWSVVRRDRGAGTRAARGGRHPDRGLPLLGLHGTRDNPYRDRLRRPGHQSGPHRRHRLYIRREQALARGRDPRGLTRPSRVDPDPVCASSLPAARTASYPLERSSHAERSVRSGRDSHDDPDRPARLGVAGQFSRWTTQASRLANRLRHLCRTTEESNSSAQ